MAPHRCGFHELNIAHDMGKYNCNRCISPTFFALPVRRRAPGAQNGHAPSSGHRSPLAGVSTSPLCRIVWHAPRLPSPSAGHSRAVPGEGLRDRTQGGPCGRRRRPRFVSASRIREGNIPEGPENQRFPFRRGSSWLAAVEEPWRAAGFSPFPSRPPSECPPQVAACGILVSESAGPTRGETAPIG